MKTSIKSVRDIYILSRFPTLLSVLGALFCIWGQSRIHHFSFAVNWGSVLGVFFLFFYLPSALILGVMLAKYKKKTQENKKMFLEIKGVKKLFWKMYLIPYLLILFNVNLFLPLKLEKNKEGLATVGEIVWQDYRFAGKSSFDFKNSDWVFFSYWDDREGKKSSFGIVKHLSNSAVVIDEEHRNHFFPQIEVHSKITAQYPLLSF